LKSETRRDNILCMPKKAFRTAAEWREWLEQNHATEKEIWLVYYKRTSGKTSVTHDEALDEALCYGWIDSIVKRLDADCYMQKWTPRKPDSVWSAVNKARIKKLTEAGRMAAPGLAKVAAAKRDGSWEKLSSIDRIGRPPDIPEDLKEALAADHSVKEKFDRLPPSQKKLWAWWVLSAKRPETRARRIAETLKGVDAGRRPGM
jgi:uncharacterized protein YdeI (YjbR/CyaY-like superfamily)